MFEINVTQSHTDSWTCEGHTLTGFRPVDPKKNIKKIYIHVYQTSKQMSSQIKQMYC